MMKRLILLLLILTGLAIPAYSQQGYTTVTATVKDPTGALYTNSQVGASFFDPGTSGKLPLIYGSTFQQSYTGYATDSFAHFSMTLADNQQIGASSGATGTVWNFTILYSDRMTSFTYKTVIDCIDNIPATCTGGVMDISAQLQAVAALLPSTGGNGAFIAVNVTGSATPLFASSGNTAFTFTLNQNVTSSLFATSAPPGTSPVYQFNICEPPSGGFIMTWPNNVILPPGYSFSTGANACSPVAFIYNPNLHSWTGFQITATGSLPTLYYQTVQNNQTSQTAYPKLNFLSPLLSTPNIGNNSSDISIPPCIGVGGSNAAGIVIAPGAVPHTPRWFFDETCNFSAPVTSTAVPNPLTSSGLTNGLFPWQINGDISPCGPNPYIDIRCYGAMPVANINAPPAFASGNLPISISSGSSTASLCGGLAGGNLTTCQGYASLLRTGEGLYVQGAGATNSSATPAAPTVLTILPSGPMATNLDVPGLTTGGTTYCYKVVGLRQGGGYTAASPSTCVTTAPASLGNQIVSINTLALSGTTLTVVTSAAHGLTAGALVNITGTSNDLYFSGWFTVSQIDSLTQFEIFSMPNNTINGAPTSATGGTIQYHNGISIVEGTPDPTIFQYLVYGRTSGTFAFVGSMWPNNSLMVGNVTYNKFQDFGAVESVPSGLASYLPLTAPSAAMNDGLSTSIISGAGTTTLTLANTALNTATGTYVVHDDVPGFNGALAVGGVVRIPYAYYFIINSFLSVPNNRFIEQIGQLTVNSTIKLNGYNTWTGETNSSSIAGQFMPESLPVITVNSGFPGFYCVGECTMRALTVLTGASPNGLLYMEDAGGVGIPAGNLDRVQFSTSSANDYVGAAILLRDLNTSGGGQHVWTDVVATGGPTQIQSSTAPLIQTSGGSGIQSKGQLFLSRRGVWFRPPTPGDISSFDSIYCQGCITPNVWGGTPGGGSQVGLLLTIHSMIQDTSFLPLFTGLGNLVGTVTIDDTTGPGGNNPFISGNNSKFLYSFSNGAYRSGGTTFASDGTFGTVQNYSTENHNLSVQIGTGYSLFSEAGKPVAPTCTPAPGSTSAIGTYTIAYAPRYTNGSEGLPSYSCTVTTTAGNQAIQLNWPAIDGAFGYDTYNNGAAKTSFPIITTLTNSFLDPAPGILGGGQSQVQVSAGGPVGFNYKLIWTPRLTLSPSAAPTCFVGLTCYYMDSTYNWPSFKPNGNTPYLSPGISASGWTSGSYPCTSATIGLLTTSGCPGIGGVPGGANLSVQYNNGGAFGGSPVPLGPNIFYYLGYQPGTSTVVGFSPTGLPGRTNSTNSDTLVDLDRATRVEETYPGVVPIAIGAPGTGPYTNNYAVKVKVKGIGANDIITPTVGTFINGLASWTMFQGQDCSITSPDNVGYKADCHDPVLIAGANMSFIRSDNSLTLNASSGGSGSSIAYAPTYSSPVKQGPMGFFGTAAVTIANSSSATSLISTPTGMQLIPANTMYLLGPGYKTYEIRADGIMSTLGAAPGNIVITVVLGGVTIDTITMPSANVPVSLSGANWTFDYKYTVTGLTTAEGGGCLTVITSTGTDINACSSVLGATGLSWYIDQVPDIKWAWATASASNSVTARVVKGIPLQNF